MLKAGRKMDQTPSVVDDIIEASVRHALSKVVAGHVAGANKNRNLATLASRHYNMAQATALERPGNRLDCILPTSIVTGESSNV